MNTYQSVTGTGAALNQLEDERAGVDAEKVYPHNIDMNCCLIVMNSKRTVHS